MPATPKPDDLSPSTLAADWQRMKSEMAPKLDTDPANLTGESTSTILRRAAYELEAAARTPALIHLQSAYDARGKQLRALADTLERQPVSNPIRSALTNDAWTERLCKAWEAYQSAPVPGGSVSPNAMKRAWLDAACRAAFPELAPSDD